MPKTETAETFRKTFQQAEWDDRAFADLADAWEVRERARKALAEALKEYPIEQIEGWQRNARCKLLREILGEEGE